ncbi:methyltransferase domain-containing protein [Prosthecobacter sp.]|uniref:methyltransferase domain-containing protein n=1 Tax=Prosthecobacter sp. TaxID=1965333 RepID=UPI002486E2A7|nr:methyltransferase domain-containing protein [Prosthecobacter sp.]MDI1310848.1 methyltransferase domain-containing protein [Prosthecobacter sp.]
MSPPLHPCPLCESDDTTEFLVRNVPGIFECQKCGFRFADSFDSEDSGLYDASFADTNVHPTYQKCNGRYVVRNRDKMIALLNKLARFKQNGRFLDVGCSAAFFLLVARECGWTPYGVEIAPWAAEFSRTELGMNVFNGRLEDASFPDNHFDVIFSSHVMEHIRRPLDLTQEMARVLRPGGAHVTVVPTQFAAPSWRFAHRFTGDPPPKHTSFFDHRTYTALLERAGLKVTSYQYNIELAKLQRLLKPEEQLLAEWRQEKSTSENGPERVPLIPRIARHFKPLINYVGTAISTGDEIVVIAEKEHN